MTKSLDKSPDLVYTVPVWCIGRRQQVGVRCRQLPMWPLAVRSTLFPAVTPAVSAEKYIPFSHILTFLRLIDFVVTSSKQWTRARPTTVNRNQFLGSAQQASSLNSGCRGRSLTAQIQELNLENLYPSLLLSTFIYPIALYSIRRALVALEGSISPR
jgi:hypothetical protein